VRRTLLSLLACILGTLPLVRLVHSGSWLIAVWVAMAIAVLPALLMRLRRPPGALQIWPGLLLLVFWLTYRYFRADAVFGFLPGSATWRDLSTLMDDLHNTMNNDSAPVHATIAVSVALCVLMALVTVLIDLLAVVGRHGALGGLPLLILLTVCGAVTREPVPWPIFVLAAIGFLILLGLDSTDDLVTWGHRIAREPSGPRRASETATAAGSGIAAPWVAALAIVIALVAGLMVPTGTHNLLSSAIRNGNGEGTGSGSDGGTQLNAFARLAGDLKRTKTIELANVSVTPGLTTQPFYLRYGVLSQVTQKGWQSSGTGPVESLDSTTFPTYPDPSNDFINSGVTNADGSVTFPVSGSVSFDATVHVVNLTGNPLVFATPTNIRGLSARTGWDALDQTLTGSSVRTGDSYDMTVQQLAPTQAELEASPRDENPLMQTWLQLPNYSPAVQTYLDNTIRTIFGAAARNPRAPSVSQYEIARRIHDYFTDSQNGFVYSLQTKDGSSGSDIVDFLQNKTGFCQQYAAAMGILLRRVGVPARVVLGYAHEVPDQNGNFKVTSKDAHAWVEVYFSGIGWVPFDPTPLAGISGGSSNDLAYAPHPTPANSLHASSGPTAGNRASNPSKSIDNGSDQGNTTSDATTTSLPVARIVFTALLFLLAAIASTPALIREQRRRRRIRRAAHSGPEPLWDELADTATDLGYAWSPARTPQQVAAWLAEPAGDALGSLTTLAQQVEHARYAPSDGAPRTDAARELRDVRSALLRDVSLWGRIKLRLLPASVLSRLPRRH
jgi:transglutaminase-like putative cysteine protease